MEKKHFIENQVLRNALETGCKDQSNDDNRKKIEKKMSCKQLRDVYTWPSNCFIQAYARYSIFSRIYVCFMVASSFTSSSSSQWHIVTNAFSSLYSCWIEEIHKVTKQIISVATMYAYILWNANDHIILNNSRYKQTRLTQSKI